jgi:membrane associated rhomboid family serine protease
LSESPPTAPVCYRHPGRETYVRCTRCDRPICPDCMRGAAVGHQCPECVAEGRRSQRPARTAFGGGATGREGYVTKALIAINVLVAIIGAAVSGGGALVGRSLFTTASWLQAVGGVAGPPVTLFDGGGVEVGAFPDLGQVYPGIEDGSIYRLVTAMFIHYGLIHLLLNMWALWVLGRDLEAVLGPTRFLGLYLLAGLGGNVAAYVLSPDSLTAGASGAIYGLFAAFFLILRRLGRDTSAIVGVLVVNLVITFSISAISWQGHLGGLLTGAMVGAVLAYAPRARRTVVQAVGGGAVLLLLVLLVVARLAASAG